MKKLVNTITNQTWGHQWRTSKAQTMKLMIVVDKCNSEVAGQNPLSRCLKVKSFSPLEPWKRVFALCDRVLLESFVPKPIFSIPGNILKDHGTPVFLEDLQECVELLILCGLLIFLKLITLWFRINWKKHTNKDFTHKKSTAVTPLF